MSKESKKKRLHNQIDRPDSESDQIFPLPGLSSESSARGFIWDIDLAGTLVACSPDIEGILGLKKDDVKGTKLSSFSNFDPSSLENEEPESTASYPIYTEIVFNQSSGEEKNFSAQIFPRVDDDGNLFGWRGISIVLGLEDKETVEEPEKMLIPSLDELLELDELQLPEMNPAQSVREPSETEDITGRLEDDKDLDQTKKPQVTIIQKSDPIDKGRRKNIESDTDELSKPESTDPVVTRSLDMDELTEMMEKEPQVVEGQEPVLLETENGSITETEGPAQTAPLSFPEDFDSPLTKLNTIEEISSHPTEDISREKAGTREFTEEEIEREGIQFTPPIETAPLSIEPDQEESFLAQIITGDDSVAELIGIIDPDPDRIWEEEELLLVEQVATQLSLALENANLFQQTQIAFSESDEQARRLQILNKMGEELSQASNLQEIYDLSVEKTRQIFKANRVSLALITPSKDGVAIVSSLGEEGRLPSGSILPLEGTANQTSISENRIIINPNVEQENLGEIKSFILGPLSVSGEIIGTLNVGNYTPEAFSDRDEAFMLQLLSLLGSIIENRQLFEAIEEALATTEEQARRLTLLNVLSERLGRANTFDEVLTITIEDIDKIIPANQCFTAIFDNTKNSFQVHSSKGSENTFPSGSEIPVNNTLSGLAMRENNLQNIGNILEESYIDTRSLSESGIRSIMVAPLFAGGEVIGTLNIGKNESHAYTSRDESLIFSISSLVSSTIDNRQLLGQIQRRSVQLETSAEVSRIASTILDTNELLPRVVELIKDGFKLYYVGLFLVDQEGDWTGEPNTWAVLRAGTGEPGRQMLEIGHRLKIGGESMIGTAVNSAEARIALDVGEEARFFRNPYLPDTRSEMALPLISRGEVLGALSIQSENEAAFSQEDITALQTMADQVANAIENAQLFEEAESRAEELTVLNEMARTYTQTMDIDKLIEYTHHYVDRLMDAANFYLAFYLPESNEIQFKLFIDEDPEAPAPNTKMKLGGGITDWIISNKQPLLLRENIYEQMKEIGIEPRGSESASYLGVPMLVGDKVTGMIAVQNYTNPLAYSNHHLDLLSSIANQVTVAIENARLFYQEQKRAEQERLVRTITDKVRRGADAQSIMRIALEELSQILEANASTIQLGTKDQLLTQSSSGNSKTQDSSEENQDE